MPVDLSRVMELLPDHVRRDQCQSGFRNAETPLTVIIMVLTYDHAVLEFGTRVDNAAVQTAIPADFGVRQQDRVGNPAE
jgi:hypothetical protein